MSRLRPWAAAVALIACIAAATWAPAAFAGPQVFDTPITGPLAVGATGALIAVNGRPVLIDRRGRQRRPAVPEGFGSLVETVYTPAPGGYLIASTKPDGVFSALLLADGALAFQFDQQDSAARPVAVAGSSGGERTVAWASDHDQSVKLEHFAGGVPATPVATLAAPGYTVDSVDLVPASRPRWLADVVSTTEATCCGRSTLQVRPLGSGGAVADPVAVRTADDIA